MTGEDAMTALTEQLQNKMQGKEFNPDKLVRTYYMEKDVFYYSDTEGEVCRHSDRPAPDYSDLPLHFYLSLSDRENPMHRLWSEGPWIKMMLAHGCYWHRCAFCDTSLDYIGRYEPASAKVIADQMEQLLEQTGYRGSIL